MLSISGVVHSFLRLRSMQPGRTLNNIVYTTTNEYSMYVTYDQSEENNSKTNNHKVNNSPKTSKQRRVRTSFRPRRDTRKRGHEYQFPGRVPLKKPSGVDFLQTSHEISKFPGCTCTQRSMTREIRWRSRSSNAIITNDCWFVIHNNSAFRLVENLLSCSKDFFFIKREKKNLHLEYNHTIYGKAVTRKRLCKEIQP